MQDVTCNPFDSEAQFRSDWRYLQITFDGQEVNPKRFCFASRENGYIEAYKYDESGEFELDADTGQPNITRMDGKVDIQGSANYQVCGVCRKNWKNKNWWEIAA